MAKKQKFLMMIEGTVYRLKIYGDQIILEGSPILSGATVFYSPDEKRHEVVLSVSAQGVMVNYYRGENTPDDDSKFFPARNTRGGNRATVKVLLGIVGNEVPLEFRVKISKNRVQDLIDGKKITVPSVFSSKEAIV